MKAAVYDNLVSVCCSCVRDDGSLIPAPGRAVGSFLAIPSPVLSGLVLSVAFNCTLSGFGYLR